MAEFPLLPIPTPVPDQRPAGPRVVSDLSLPTRAREGERLQPVFQRLRDVFDGQHDAVTLREDPAGIAPERALVLEVVGAISDFQDAARRIPGLEYLGDEEAEFEPDADFAIRDTRKGRKGQTRDDKRVAGRLYLAMPDTRALQELVRLWARYQAGEDPARGFAPWFDLFDRLRQLRAWGPLDRVPESTIEWLAGRVGSTHGSRPRRNRALELPEHREAAASFSPIRTSSPCGRRRVPPPVVYPGYRVRGRPRQPPGCRSSAPAATRPVAAHRLR